MWCSRCFNQKECWAAMIHVFKVIQSFECRMYCITCEGDYDSLAHSSRGDCVIATSESKELSAFPIGTEGETGVRNHITRPTDE
jgi:hypothetical protein